MRNERSKSQILTSREWRGGAVDVCEHIGMSISRTELEPKVFGSVKMVELFYQFERSRTFARPRNFGSGFSEPSRASSFPPPHPQNWLGLFFFFFAVKGRIKRQHQFYLLCLFIFSQCSRPDLSSALVPKMGLNLSHEPGRLRPKPSSLFDIHSID